MLHNHWQNETSYSVHLHQQYYQYPISNYTKTLSSYFNINFAQLYGTCTCMLYTCIYSVVHSVTCAPIFKALSTVYYL